MPSLENNTTEKRVLFLLVLIIIAGAIFRFYGLERQSFWNDELSTVDIIKYNKLSSVIIEGVFEDNSHPRAYFLFLYFVKRYKGNSEMILRFPPAIGGVISIFIIFLLGKLLYSYREGLIASSLMAVFWCPIYYSQEARTYSILLLFTMLASYCWVSILRSLSQNEKVSWRDEIIE